MRNGHTHNINYFIYYTSYDFSLATTPPQRGCILLFSNRRKIVITGFSSFSKAGHIVMFNVKHTLCFMVTSNRGKLYFVYYMEEKLLKSFQIFVHGNEQCFSALFIFGKYMVIQSMPTNTHYIIILMMNHDGKNFRSRCCDGQILYITSYIMNLAFSKMFVMYCMLSVLDVLAKKKKFLRRNKYRNIIIYY